MIRESGVVFFRQDCTTSAYVFLWSSRLLQGYSCGGARLQFVRVLFSTNVAFGLFVCHHVLLFFGHASWPHLHAQADHCALGPVLVLLPPGATAPICRPRPFSWSWVFAHQRGCGEIRHASASLSTLRRVQGGVRSVGRGLFQGSLCSVGRRRRRVL